MTIGPWPKPLAERWPKGDVHFFRDDDWLATRSLAHGTVLSSQLKRAFLFYPPGVTWEERPPEPSAWVHNMGAIDRENAGEPKRLTEALRWRWNALAQPR